MTARIAATASSEVRRIPRILRPRRGIRPNLPPAYKRYPWFPTPIARVGQDSMQSPHPMHPSWDTETTPRSGETSITFAGQTAAQIPQKVHACLPQRGSIDPLIPMSFSSALRQLLAHPEIPTLNL